MPQSPPSSRLSASPSDGQRAIHTRSRGHRGSTCQNCRIRKTRCDGTQPTCRTCEAYQAECRYEQPPTMYQIVGMAKRLQEAEATVVELRTVLASMNTELKEPNTAESDTIPSQIFPATETSVNPFSAAYTEEPRATYSLSRSATNSTGSLKEELLSDLSTDASGKEHPFDKVTIQSMTMLICSQGCNHIATFVVHDSAMVSNYSPNFHTHRGQNLQIDVRTLLTSNAMELRACEEFAISNAALQNNIPQDIISRLLRMYWVAIDPMFLWVYRPALMRDMITGGQYCTPLLLNVMCGHAASFDERKLAEIFLARARLLLEAEIHKPGSISTIQALLQLSARDLAYGQVSQAWTYSGIAFRMAHDMGLRHSSGAVYGQGSLSAEDLEIRRRCFWSCYLWDKAISLYLGRMPVLTELPSNQYPQLLDDFQEHDLWLPDDASMANPPGINTVFPAMKLHVVSAFINACKLSVIISDIVLCLYSGRQGEDVDTASRAIGQRLNSWRALTPDHLRIDLNDLPNMCPAPHIVSQNLLYYAAIILLHRPFISSPVHHATCLRATESSEKLIMLQERTHGVTSLSFLSAYSIYTAASVLVQDAKVGEPIASRRIENFLRTLATSAKTCLLIQRSMDIITSSLNSDTMSSLPIQESEQPLEKLLVTQRLPACLYHHTNLDYVAHFNVG